MTHPTLLMRAVEKGNLSGDPGSAVIRNESFAYYAELVVQSL